MCVKWFDKRARGRNPKTTQKPPPRGRARKKCPRNLSAGGGAGQGAAMHFSGQILRRRPATGGSVPGVGCYVAAAATRRGGGRRAVVEAVQEQEGVEAAWSRGRGGCSAICRLSLGKCLSAMETAGGAGLWKR